MRNKVVMATPASRLPDASVLEAWCLRPTEADCWIRSYVEGKAQATESRRSVIDGLEAVTLFDVSTLGTPAYPPGLPFSHFLIGEGNKIITVISGAVFPWANPVYRKAVNGISAINWERQETAPYVENVAHLWRRYGLEKCVPAFFNHEAPGKYLWAGEASLAHIFEIHTCPDRQGQGHARRALTTLWPHLESFQSVGITSLYLWTQTKPKRFSLFLKKEYQFQTFHWGYYFNRCLLRISPDHREGLKKYQGPTVLDALEALVEARRQANPLKVKPGASPEKVDTPG